MKYLGISLLFTSVIALVFAAAGCAGRAEILPNSDASLHRSSAEFAADSAKRFPYKADAPRGGLANGRAQVGYWVDRIEIENLGDTDWDNVEIWVNKSYVVWLPKIKAHAGKVTAINFRSIFDDAGHSFPTDNTKTLVNSVEVYYGGTMYDVKTQLAD